MLLALNKIDLLKDTDSARKSLETFPNAVAISALTGEGVSDLLEAINDALFENYVDVSLFLPYNEGGLISLFHEQGRVEMIEHDEEGIHISGVLPNRLLARYAP